MSTAVITVIEQAKIDAINEAHHSVEAAYGIALNHAIDCGRMLQAVKVTLETGRWGDWISENFHGSLRVAQTYMQLVNHEAEIAEAQTSAPMSIDAALKHIAKPKPAPKPANDIISTLRGLNASRTERDDPDRPETPIARERIDEARERIQADTPPREAVWTDQHSRRRHKIIDLLEEARSQLDHASESGLSAYSVNGLLRDAETKARQATAQLGDLALQFER